MGNYLAKNTDGTYSEKKGFSIPSKDWIEIPEGAEVAMIDNENISFAKPINDGDDVLVWDVGFDVDWDTTKWESWIEFADYGFNIIWQRATHPGELPFIDDEPKSLNDQYAEIEKFRQDNVNHPSHYTQGKVECIDALESATIGKSGIEAVCVANVIKYLWRYEEKNGLEDVKKAQWYLERLVASMDS